jgi:hypothetical protein
MIAIPSDKATAEGSQNSPLKTHSSKREKNPTPKFPEATYNAPFPTKIVHLSPIKTSTPPRSLKKREEKAVNKAGCSLEAIEEYKAMLFGKSKEEVSKYEKELEASRQEFINFHDLTELEITRLDECLGKKLKSPKNKHKNSSCIPQDAYFNSHEINWFVDSFLEDEKNAEVREKKSKKSKSQTRACISTTMLLETSSDIENKEIEDDSDSAEDTIEGNS